MNIITATKTKTLTDPEKRDRCARIQRHIEDRGLVAKRLAEVKSTQAEAFAYVFVLQLSFRGIEDEDLCWELAQLAGISRTNYDQAVREI